MRGISTVKETKTSKTTNKVVNGKEVITEVHSGQYVWKELAGEITVTLTVPGKKPLTLLKLSNADYDMSVAVKSDDPIEEMQQKQISVADTA